MTTQAPHAIRTVLALVAGHVGLQEDKIRVISPDIGGGFGGISFVKSLKNENVEIILIDKNNYHLFQPLLYQVAGTVLSPSDIAVPLRWIFRKQKNVKVRLDEVLRLLMLISIESFSSSILYFFTI